MAVAMVKKPIKFGFPSPCGVNIVANSDSLQSMLVAFSSQVSVPLRGKYRGESKLLGMQLTMQRPLWFPSPCGVNIVANLKLCLKKNRSIATVSVPLRGKYRGE